MCQESFELKTSQRFETKCKTLNVGKKKFLHKIFFELPRLEIAQMENIEESCNLFALFCEAFERCIVVSFRRFNFSGSEIKETVITVFMVEKRQS